LNRRYGQNHNSRVTGNVHGGICKE
jgi:hypothetical protein